MGVGMGSDSSCTDEERRKEAAVSHQGKTQVTFICTATVDQVAEGDRLFASHAAWMERTHYRDGELALLRYNIVKGPELSNAWAPHRSRPARRALS